MHWKKSIIVLGENHPDTVAIKKCMMSSKAAKNKPADAATEEERNWWHRRQPYKWIPSKFLERQEGVFRNIAPGSNICVSLMISRPTRRTRWSKVNTFF